MRILVAHNRYQEKGGEDRVVAEETAMLHRFGHQVETFVVDNDHIDGLVQQLGAALDCFYSRNTARALPEIVADFRPEVLHVHNFMPRISPSIYLVAERLKLPVVQTIHNFRLICSNAQLFRDGHVCEECPAQRSILPAIQHRCYRGSRLGSAVLGGSMALHDALGTWKHRVARYILLSEFAAEKMTAWRIPRERVSIKPNFVADLGCGPGGGGFALFAGRLSPEKGLSALIEADRTDSLELPLWIVGSGTLQAELEQAARRPGSRLKVLGPKPQAEVQQLLRAAEVLVVPSLWFEGMPMIVVEAFCAGLPIVSSNRGSLPGMVEHGVTGLNVDPEDTAALTDAINQFATPSERSRAMRSGARAAYENHYSEERNHAMLLAIYQQAIAFVGQN